MGHDEACKGSLGHLPYVGVGLTSVVIPELSVTGVSNQASTIFARQYWYVRTKEGADQQQNGP